VISLDCLLQELIAFILFILKLFDLPSQLFYGKFLLIQVIIHYTHEKSSFLRLDLQVLILCISSFIICFIINAVIIRLVNLLCDVTCFVKMLLFHVWESIRVRIKDDMILSGWSTIRGVSSFKFCSLIGLKVACFYILLLIMLPTWIEVCIRLLS
jgi:hypothetical protein